MQYWRHKYEWRAQEARINSIPNFIAEIPQPAPAPSSKLHFLHVTSADPNARTVLFQHGWPGSFLEFIDILNDISSAGDLNLVVPSMPGYAFSDSPPLDRDFSPADVCTLLYDLMKGLDYTSYAAQGGDWGVITGRMLAVNHPEVKAVHLNCFVPEMPPSLLHTLAPSAARWKAVDLAGRFAQRVIINPVFGKAGFALGLSQQDLKGLSKAEGFMDGFGYGMMHQSRPATIAATVSASPLSLLAWMGEKILAWSDKDTSLDEILTHVTLWWLTETFAPSIYPYRHLDLVKASDPKWIQYITQPTGFSSFAAEVTPVPRSWAACTCNLRWYRYHDQGGHFAAMEKPHELAQDLREFLDLVWPVNA